MSIYRELEYTSEISQVNGIRFTILSPDEIKKMSVCEIYKTDTYVGSEPVPNGLFDLRTGTIEPNKICPTCLQKSTFCVGHLSYIELAKPVFYIQFFDIIKKILKCVCFRCSNLLVNPDSEIMKTILSKKLSRQKRWELIYKLCMKAKRCDGCGAKQPDKISKATIVKVVMEWKEVETEDDVKKQIFRAEEVLRILKRISDKDCEILGFNPKFNRPEWMICTRFPVPPPTVRPSVRSDTGQRSEDDLTHKLCDIVKSNNALKLRIEKGASKEQIDLNTELLQYHVATFIDNKIPGINPAQQRTGRLLKSLTERLKSKEGRIRGNLMGKRVDFSARSVITPDPNISIDELGVPIKIAMNLTFPEVVNKYNKDKLMEYVRNGPDKYPGAKFIRLKGNITKSLKNFDRENVVLEYGNIVDRHLINGDPVLFNRQPSLHRSSMLCHRVRVMPFNTFRLNVCVCAGYNADFDGDEMNMHVPQSTLTAVELQDLASVNTQIISPRECKPIISVVQDIALGIYRMTRSDVRINEKQMMNLLSTNIKFDGILPKPIANGEGGVRKWTGQNAISTIIPKNITLIRKNKNYDESKENNAINNIIKIENGEFLQGTLDKTIYQDRTVGLIHSITNECNNEEARLFFDNTQKIICNWLVSSGFSVGISDLIIDAETTNSLKEEIRELKVKVYDLIKKIHMGKFENKSINKNNEYFEDQVNEKLNATRDEVGKKAMSKIKDTNRMINMIKSGSKGSPLNVSQMVGCLGQQNVDGKRIANGFDERTLPHYVKFDDSPESHGFVENSFITGLSPQEFFFHAMGGREGLIDTAVKSVTGDTTIIIMENDKAKYVKIGEWIDGHLERRSKSIDHYPEDRNMEFLPLDTKVYIPTADNHGNTSWGEMTAVTRHDPGERLYEVVTQSGRKVTVAESKSLLIWNEKLGEFQAKHSLLVKPGDFVPVTCFLPEPPTVITTVDMEEYFPKTECIWGTEFIKARELMDDAMNNRKRIPEGWWKNNNGKTFTLPYTKKASLTRVTSGRSNIDNIVEGCIYPYRGGNRDAGLMPDKFDLNYENGIFLGLYIAEGSCCVKSGHVAIANVDPKVKAFVRGWFEKHKMAIFEENRQMKLGDNNCMSTGTTSSVLGNSTLLAKFLDKFVGHGAANKFIPSVAFVAPLEFVRGLLNGYFSGDGCVGKTCGVACSSISYRLIEGISTLLNRFGIFAKISSIQMKKNNLGTKNIAPTYNLSIRGPWAGVFADNIELMIDYKQERLRTISRPEVHRNFQSHHDVVLDKIIDIHSIGVENNPKLYDVTVPSTLNFATANAVNLMDTSEVGYLQRRLVKAMEDCKINYDYTVRNASGSIVQFLYGDDGVDPIKIESQLIEYVHWDYPKIMNEFLWTKADDMAYLLAPEVIAGITATTYEKLEAHFHKVCEDREFLIKKILLVDGTCDNMLYYPISFTRIITIAKATFNKYDGGLLSDLDPAYVLEQLAVLERELFFNKLNKGTKFLNILLRCHLSPKRVCCEYRFGKLAFDHIIQTVRMRFYDAIANPSEMVGVVAAQSIGEPTTQLSAFKRTKILIRDLDKNYFGEIGEFIDDLLKKNKGNIVDLGNDSVVLDLDKDYYIVGVSDDEKTSWKRISQISRHPANGGLVKVYTKSGKTTCATLSHSFLKRTESKIVPITGYDLKKGDRIPVAKYIPLIDDPMMFVKIGEDEYDLDFNFGWLCGTYIADGCLNSSKITITKIIPEYVDNLRAIVASKFGLPLQIRTKTGKIDAQKNGKWDKLYVGQDNSFNHREFAQFLEESFGKGSYNKKLPAWIYTSNLDFIKGIIGGYFDGDGNVEGTKGKGVIRAHSVCENLVDQVIILLAYVGIFASKGLEPKKEEHLGDLHVIRIMRKYARAFKDNIGFVVHSKSENLDKVVEYMESEERFSAKEEIDMIPEIGHVIAFVGKALEYSDQSRTYGRWAKKSAIGRSTLIKYIKTFEETFNALPPKKRTIEIADNISILKQAAYSDVVWDEIVDLEYIEDPKEYVYDFTVPGNDSFMVDCGVLVHNTLNSVDWHTEMLFNVNGEYIRKPIGKFVDDELKINKDIESHPNDTSLGWIKEKNVQVLSCDEDGKILWKLVEAVTKHPPINEDGSNMLLKVITHSGREVIATKAKSFLKRVDNKIIQVHGSDLNVGDYLPVSNTFPNLGEKILTWENVPLDTDFGYKFGSYLLGGRIDNLNIHVTENRVPPQLFNAPNEFLQGLINSIINQSVTLRGLLEDVQLIMTKFNMPSQIVSNDNAYTLQTITNDVIPNVVTESLGNITIPRSELSSYIEKCENHHDKQILQNIISEQIIYDKIISIEEIPSSHPHVYDLTVKDTRNFNAYNSLCLADTFHSSGISSASKTVRGVPRIKELLSVTKNIKSPSMTIYIKDEFNQDKVQCTKILKSIQTTYFKEIVRSSKIYFDPDNFNTTIKEDVEFIQSYRDFLAEDTKASSYSPWLLRFEFDEAKMYNNNLTMMEIVYVFNEYYNDIIQAMFSDDNSNNLVCRIRLQKTDKDNEDRDIITELKALEKTILETLTVKGIKKINKVHMKLNKTMKYNDESMKVEQYEEWVMDTSGTNILDILSHNQVDASRTVSNDINEIYEIFGIEAARQVLFNELSSTLRELYVNYRHIALLVDTMTNKGYLMSIDRHGINRVDIGPLAKCSFEETTDMLIKAGIFSEVDHINGVSANIMLGQIPPSGTGDSDILIDEWMLHDHGEEIKQEKEIKKELENIDPEDVCTLDNLTFDFVLPEKDETLKPLKMTLNIL